MFGLLHGLLADLRRMRPPSRCFGLGDDFLDPRGMNAPVGDQLVQRQPGDLAAHRVEAADDHHARACRR